MDRDPRRPVGDVPEPPDDARRRRGLPARERETRRIVDSLPGLVATLAPGGEVGTVNQPLVEFCGRPFTDLRHWFADGTIHPHDVAHASRACTRAVDLGEPCAVEMRLRRFDGVYRWFQCRATPSRDTADGDVRWYVLLSDIDGLKRAEAARRRGERAQLEERLRERERIARALHDTLLQGAQGFVLMVQAATFRMPPGDAARAMLEDAVERVRAVIEDGRDRIQDLRASEHHDIDLPTRLAMTGRELAGDDAARFRFALAGTPHELHSTVADEAFLIARAALINAFTHAGLATVDLDMRYEDGQLVVRIVDDGPGVAPEVLASGGAPGHWGLRGMRERAERMRATLDVRRGAERGTQVELRIAANVAYRW